MSTPSALARAAAHRRLRVGVVVASAAGAIAGSAVLAMHGSGQKLTTRGVAATLRVPGHPGWVAAGRDALWFGLSGTETPVRQRPLLRLDLASGSVEQRILVGGRVSYLVHAGNRLLASVEHVGGTGSGPSLVVAVDWRSGRLLARRQFPTLVGPVAQKGKSLWVLQTKPGALLRLDRLTLVPTAAPLPLSHGRAVGLAVGGGFVWATAADAGEVLRIDPRSRAVARVRIGGFPVGIAFARGRVWFTDRERAEVGSIDPRTLRPAGKPIRVGGKPAWLAQAGHFLFVGDAARGTVDRIDERSARASGRPIRVAPPAKAAPALALAPAGGSVWVSSFASSSLTRVSTTSTASAPRAVVASSRPGAAVGGGTLPRGASVIARIPLGKGAPAPLGGGAFTVGEGAVWAMSDVELALLRIDPARNAVVARIEVSPPEALAAGDGAVWLSYPGENVVKRIDPRTNAVTATIHAGPQPSGIAVSPDAVWVANAGGPSVGRIDPATNRVVARIRVGSKLACCSEHMSLTVVPGAVWVAVPNANRLVRVNPATNKVVASVNLPYSPCAFLVGDESAVWSAGGGCADMVGRIDTRTNRLTRTLYEPHAVGLGLAFGSLWAAVLDSANVERIDSRSGRLLARLHVGGNPVRLAVGFGSVWVNDDNGRVLRIEPRR